MAGSIMLMEYQGRKKEILGQNNEAFAYVTRRKENYCQVHMLIVLLQPRCGFDYLKRMDY